MHVARAADPTRRAGGTSTYRFASSTARFIFAVQFACASFRWGFREGERPLT
jgi:hypothetical protein